MGERGREKGREGRERVRGWRQCSHCETGNACYLRLLTTAQQWETLLFGGQSTGRGGGRSR